MEDVVILKRGEQNQAKVTAEPEQAKTVVAADQHRPQVEKGETVAANAKQSSAQVENAEPVAPAADTRAKKKAEAADKKRGADATTNAAKAKAVAPSDRKDVKNVAAAKQSGGKQGMMKALYSGPSFAAAPEPRELPIPFLLLKGRGARLRPRDDAERAAPTAAAA